MVFSLSESRTGTPVGKVDAVAGRWLLWVDGVGGYLLVPGDDWTIGGPSGADEAEICVQGDLSRREACIRRQGSDYVLQPLGTVLLGGRRMNRPAMLRDGDMVVLGSGAAQSGAAQCVPRPHDLPLTRGVRMEFSRPHPLSASAKLRIDTRHKTRPRSDAVILLADTCILGPTRGSHILAADATGEVVLLFRQGSWFCRSEGETIVDGKASQGRVEVPIGSRVETSGLSLTLEAIPS